MFFNSNDTFLHIVDGRANDSLLSLLRFSSEPVLLITSVRSGSGANLVNGQRYKDDPYHPTWVKTIFRLLLVFAPRQPCDGGGGGGRNLFVPDFAELMDSLFADWLGGFPGRGRGRCSAGTRSRPGSPPPRTASIPADTRTGTSPACPYGMNNRVFPAGVYSAFSWSESEVCKIFTAISWYQGEKLHPSTIG
jgi:hypothetical protein